MTIHYRVVAKPGFADALNAAYAATIGHPNDFLVYSADVIRDEIAFLHSPAGAAFAPLRDQITDVSCWAAAFPEHAENVGYFSLHGAECDAARSVAVLDALTKAAPMIESMDEVAEIPTRPLGYDTRMPGVLLVTIQRNGKLCAADRNAHGHLEVVTALPSSVTLKPLEAVRISDCMIGANITLHGQYGVFPVGDNYDDAAIATMDEIRGSEDYVWLLGCA